MSYTGINWDEIKVPKRFTDLNSMEFHELAELGVAIRTQVKADLDAAIESLNCHHSGWGIKTSLVPSNNGVRDCRYITIGIPFSFDDSPANIGTAITLLSRIEQLLVEVRQKEADASLNDGDGW